MRPGEGCHRYDSRGSARTAVPGGDHVDLFSHLTSRPLAETFPDFLSGTNLASRHLQTFLISHLDRNVTPVIASRRARTLSSRTVGGFSRIVVIHRTAPRQSSRHQRARFACALRREESEDGRAEMVVVVEPDRREHLYDGGVALRAQREQNRRGRNKHRFGSGVLGRGPTVGMPAQSGPGARRTGSTSSSRTC